MLFCVRLLLVNNPLHLTSFVSATEILLSLSEWFETNYFSNIFNGF
jgi:hypothetical protein